MSSKSFLPPLSGLELVWEAEFDRRFTSRKRGAKPVSAGQLLSTSAWLDDELCWHERRVCWRRGTTLVGVEAANALRTSRALQTLVKRGSARDVVARRQATLKWAAPLLEVEAPDLTTLCAHSRRLNPAAIARLKLLLVVEALSATSLEASPARALVKAWPLSRSVLLELCQEEQWPAPVGALAALCLGAVGETPLALSALRRVMRLTHAIDWCEDNRLEPALLASGAFEGEATLWRYVMLAQQEATSSPDNTELRSDCQRLGVTAAIAIAESVATVPEVWPQFPNVQWEAQHFSTRRLKRRAEEVKDAQLMWRDTKRAAQAELRPLWLDLARHDLKAPAAAAEWLHTLLSMPVELTAFLTRRQQRKRVALSSDEIALFATETVKWWYPHALELVQRAAQFENPTATFALLNEVTLAFWEKERDNLERVNTSAQGIGAWGTIHEALNRSLFCVLKLIQCCGPEFARRAWEQEVCYTLDQEWPSVEWPEVAFHLLKIGGGRGYRLIPEFFRRIAAFEQPRIARQWCDEIVQRTPYWPTTARHEIFMAALEHRYKNQKSARTTLLLLPSLLEPLVAATHAWDDNIECDITALSRAVISLAEEVTEKRLQSGQIYAFVPILCEAIVARCRNESIPTYIDYLACVAALLANTPAQFQDLVVRLWPLLERDWDMWEVAWKGIKLVHWQPPVLESARLAFGVAPERTFVALGHLGALARAGAVDSFEVLLWSEDALFSHASEAWEEVIRLDRALEMPLCEWQRWSHRSQQPLSFPSSVRKVMSWPQSWQQELAALRRKVDCLDSSAGPHAERLQTRIQNLEARLADAEDTRRAMSEEIRDALRNATKHAALSALESLVQKALGARLQTLCGAAAREVELDADVLNALLLACEVESNRKWARQILRQHFEGTTAWRELLPANARYLSRLREQGMDVTTFLSRFERNRGEWTFWLETEPLSVLQMGNHVDTCLSRGGCNAHSSIANAIDLNKRVAYVRNRCGHIIGRQLWALSSQHQLVGFYVYSTLPTKSREPLQRAFTAYAREFALACGVELADEGEVENLVVSEWYDDGLAEWEPKDEEVCQTD